jgi:hypothetical protein
MEEEIYKMNLEDPVVSECKKVVKNNVREW